MSQRFNSPPPPQGAAAIAIRDYGSLSIRCLMESMAHRNSVSRDLQDYEIQFVRNIQISLNRCDLEPASNRHARTLSSEAFNDYLAMRAKIYQAKDDWTKIINEQSGKWPASEHNIPEPFFFKYKELITRLTQLKRFSAFAKAP